jgi:hypothetical protein
LGSNWKIRGKITVVSNISVNCALTPVFEVGVDNVYVVVDNDSAGSGGNTGIDGAQVVLPRERFSPRRIYCLRSVLNLKF